MEIMRGKLFIYQIMDVKGQADFQSEIQKALPQNL